MAAWGWLALLAIPHGDEPDRHVPNDAHGRSVPANARYAAMRAHADERAPGSCVYALSKPPAEIRSEREAMMRSASFRLMADS